MDTITITYIIIAFLISVSVSFFQYFYQIHEKSKTSIILFSLRSFSIFLLLLLFINPSIEKKQFVNQKPVLSILVDNSISIAYFKQEEITKKLIANFKKNNSLNEKFDVQYFSFGNSLKVLDSLIFDDPQTNIYNALQEVEALQKGINAPIILISDGNQTKGNLYEHFNTNKNVYPIIIGDTTVYSDVKIEQLNVNKYSYLNNRFPVECRVLYDGSEDVETEFRLSYNGKIIYKKKLFFTEDKNVQTIKTTVKSAKKGIQYYTASVKKIKKEKNTQNNKKVFSVEVLDEQTKVLILTDVFHPDLGALKKSIETNKQRSVSVRNIKNIKNDIDDFQLVILYQPNNNFNSFFQKIKKEKVNYFVVTGTNTDWSFLNKMELNFIKNNIDQTEDYGAELNPGFLSYTQKEIPFHTFPPLKDAFGKITLTARHDALLYQNISGIKTKTPLLAFFEDKHQKSAVLFGENIWKWRAASFLNTGSFEEFDGFISNLTQYLSSNKKRERLSVIYKNIYASNEPVHIRAFYLDKNYRFDSRAALNLKITNTGSKVVQNIPFSLKNNAFENQTIDLPAGTYNFIVEVAKQKLFKRGTFKITNYQIEEQFVTANRKNLEILALQTEGEVYTVNNEKELIKKILSDAKYYTIQKVNIIKKQLIEWQLVLFLILCLLSAEWFIRKYYGKI